MLFIKELHFQKLLLLKKSLFFIAFTYVILLWLCSTVKDLSSSNEIMAPPPKKQVLYLLSIEFVKRILYI